MSVYTENELADLGLAHVGRNVRLSRRASLYGVGRISIGDNSRIDDFCVLSAGEGGIEIGSYVHLGAMVTLIGRGKIAIGDLSTLSGRVSVYSSSDDYSGAHMTNPTVPEHLTGVEHRDIIIGRHVIVGCASVLIPGAAIEDGVAVGAISLVKDRLVTNSIFAGIPAKRTGPRQTGMYELEKSWNDRN